MSYTNALLGLFTETSLHAGAGQSVGVIDLPIQREAHNAWPCVFGSAVKGAIRAKAEADKLEEVDLIFGQADFKAGEASEFAAALAISDARLLLLPVRSLTTHFRWVTCPSALRRWQRDAERLGLGNRFTFTVPDFNDNDAALVAADLNGHLYLEEYRLTVKKHDLNDVLTALAQMMPDELKEALTKQFTLVSDDTFQHLAQHATPVTAHVRLDDKKTVEKGALWYEETLPPESLLYVALNAGDSRKKDTTLNAETIIKRLREKLFSAHPYLQIGGNETVGMGWCRVSFLDTLGG